MKHIPWIWFSNKAQAWVRNISGRVRVGSLRGGSGQDIANSCGCGAGLKLAERERTKNFNLRRTPMHNQLNAKRELPHIMEAEQKYANYYVTRVTTSGAPRQATTDRQTSVDRHHVVTTDRGYSWIILSVDGPLPCLGYPGGSAYTDPQWTQKQIFNIYLMFRLWTQCHTLLLETGNGLALLHN